VAKGLHIDPAALEEIESARQTLDEARELGGDLLVVAEATVEAGVVATSTTEWIDRLGR